MWNLSSGVSSRIFSIQAFVKVVLPLPVDPDTTMLLLQVYLRVVGQKAYVHEFHVAEGKVEDVPQFLRLVPELPHAL